MEGADLAFELAGMLGAQVEQKVGMLGSGCAGAAPIAANNIDVIDRGLSHDTNRADRQIAQKDFEMGQIKGVETPLSIVEGSRV